MTEPRAAYLSENPFTCEQLADICDYLEIIRAKSGFGKIAIEVYDGEIAFIKLGEVSRKYLDKGGRMK